MAVTELYNLRKDFAVKPTDKKEVLSVRFYRDHSSLFTIDQKHNNTVLERDAYLNNELSNKLAEWVAKGFTIS